MNPVYSAPDFAKKTPSDATSSQKTDNKTHLSIQAQADNPKPSSPKDALTASPSLVGNVQKAHQPISFRSVSSQDLINLLKDDTAVAKAIQDGSIFEMQFASGNALRVACHLEKFDLAEQLLAHPLASEAFLQNLPYLAGTLQGLYNKLTTQPKETYAFLKTFIQHIDLQAVNEYQNTDLLETSDSLITTPTMYCIARKDIQTLKTILGKFNEEGRTPILRHIRATCIEQLKSQEPEICVFFKELITENILQTDQDFYKDFVKGADAFTGYPTAVSTQLARLEFLKHEKLINPGDGTETFILADMAKTASLQQKLEDLSAVLAYAQSNDIDVFTIDFISSLADIGRTLSAETPPETLETLKKNTKAVFSYMQSFGHEGLLNNRFISGFLANCNFEWNPLQESYYNAVLDQMTELLGKERFLECIENPSILRYFVNPQDLSRKSESTTLIKSLIARGASPMVNIHETVPYPLVTLDISIETQRCLAQSQHPEYKAFVLASMFGLKSAKLIGSNPTGSIPIIDKSFASFQDAFPSKLDTAIVDRIQKAYKHPLILNNRIDLLKAFTNHPTDSDDIQVVYLNAEEHAYAYLIYKDMLIETQRDQRLNTLDNKKELFYLTNITTSNEQKVRAIQMLPLDPTDARALLDKQDIPKDYHLRFGKDILAFCKQEGTRIQDLAPLLEGLGLETSYSILTEPLQQKKVALGQVLQGLDLLKKDGSGAILDALKDKDSAELAQDLVKGTTLDPKTLVTWLEDSSLSKVDFLKNVLEVLGVTQKQLYYVSDADRKDPLAAIAFEKTPQKTGNCYFASPMLNFGALMWWATVLERAKEEGITVTREHVGQNPDFYKHIYKEVEPTYKEWVRFMKLNAWDEYQKLFGKLPDAAMQAEIEAKVAKLKSPSYRVDSEEDM